MDSETDEMLTGWGCIVVLIAAIYITVRHIWPIVLTIAAIVLVLGLVLYFVAKHRGKVANQRRAEEEARQAEIARRQAAEEARRRAEEATRNAEESRLQQHRAEQERYRQQMVVLCEKVIKLFESIPLHITMAEKDLDQAEIDFAEGVYGPFWDSVQSAAQWLSWLNRCVGELKDMLARYAGLAKQYELAPPAFPLHVHAVEKLAAGTATSDRMKAIVRKAQSNFQFSMIFEHRKANQISAAGFTSLEQALVEMTWRFTTSIGDLVSSVAALDPALNEPVLAVEKVIEKLDEIQGRRC